MKKMKIAFLGGRILGYNCLKILNEYKDQIEVVFVIAHKKDGEKNSDWNPQLLPLAKKLGFKILKPDSLKKPSMIKKFRKEKIDLILNPFCNRIIPKEILDLPKLGTINFHYGKLPKYKGRFIVSHIILNGEKETCATAHYMEEEVDAGDIIYEKKVPVLPDDTARTLYFRCTEAAEVLFRKVLENIISGKKIPRKKQIGQGNYFPFEEPNGCQVDLNWSKDEQERFIRALTFEPISNPWIKVGKIEFDIILKKKNPQ